MLKLRKRAGIIILILIVFGVLYQVRDSSRTKRESENTPYPKATVFLSNDTSLQHKGEENVDETITLVMLLVLMIITFIIFMLPIMLLAIVMTVLGLQHVGVVMLKKLCHPKCRGDGTSKSFANHSK